MENQIDLLTQKLYNEGIEKANKEAEVIVKKAKEEAEKLIRDARTEAENRKAESIREIEGLQNKAESEMTLSARQAITALKQSISGLITDEISGEIARTGFEDQNFIREIMVKLIEKWKPEEGGLDISLALPESEEKNFKAFITQKHKTLLDKGLEIKTGADSEAFVISPKDGGYKISFSESLFKNFISQYMRGFAKKMLFKE